MKPVFVLLGAITLLLKHDTGVEAQPEQLPEPLYSEDFERGIGFWRGLGDAAKVAREIDATKAHQGISALRFDYAVGKGQVNLLATTVVPPSVATLQSINFWIKSGYNASYILVVQEQGGGRFNTEFSTVKDEWQHVVVTPDELILQQGKDDPKDDDGILNLDKVGSFALVDFEQVFAQLAGDIESPAAKLLGVTKGPRSFFFDDVLISGKRSPLPIQPPDAIDDFSRPQPRWFTVGDTKLKLVPGEKPELKELSAQYTQKLGALMTAVKLLRPGTLTGKTALKLNLKSQQHATLVVEVEEKGGGKYNFVLDTPGDNKLLEKTLEFTSFKAADNSKDDNNQLDLSAVKQLSIIDAAGMLGVDNTPNELRISLIKAE